MAPICQLELRHNLFLLLNSAIVVVLAVGPVGGYIQIRILVIMS